MAFLDTLGQNNTQQPTGFIGNLGTLPKPEVKSSLPLLTKESGDIHQNMRTATKDIVVGAGKDLIEGARGVTSGLQNFGQSALSGLFHQPLAEVKANTGIKSLDSSTPESSQIDEQLKAKSRGEQTGKVLSAVTQIVAPFSGGTAEKLIAKGKSAYEGFQASREAKSAADATSKVAETISPKATAKEAKLAQTQGRFVEGKEGGYLTKGTPDKILPSKKTLSASETITKNIPGADKMSEGQLFKAVDENITKTAKELRPVMEKTPIKPETIQKINDDWTGLKKTQLLEAPATEEANVAKRQAKFESLLKKSGNQSHADLWDTRIAYDDSIPERVKQASSISDESLQLQKQEWLDNREILNDAINARPEFKQMSDMYTAKQGILSKTKVEKAQLSKISQTLKKHPNIVRVLKAAGLYEGLKLLGVRVPSL